MIASAMPLDPAMEPGLPLTRTRQTPAFPVETIYIVAMSEALSRPIAAEITRRLTEALDPTHLQVIDDSEKHRGHAGHDPRGESHFTVDIESPAFAGLSRVARQRAVNAALAELLKERVHALSIKARAPGE
jgi:BolA protein